MLALIFLLTLLLLSMLVLSDNSGGRVAVLVGCCAKLGVGAVIRLVEEDEVDETDDEL